MEPRMYTIQQKQKRLLSGTHHHNSTYTKPFWKLKKVYTKLDIACRFVSRQLSRRTGKHSSESVEMAKQNPLYTAKDYSLLVSLESFLLFVSYYICHTESLTVKSLWDYWDNKTKTNDHIGYIAMQTQLPQQHNDRID